MIRKGESLEGLGRFGILGQMVLEILGVDTWDLERKRAKVGQRNRRFFAFAIEGISFRPVIEEPDAFKESPINKPIH